MIDRKLSKIIHENMEWHGPVSVPGKSQYVRDEAIFTCPFCGWKVGSNSYRFFGSFEKVCAEHLSEKHYDEVFEEGARE